MGAGTRTAHQQSLTAPSASKDSTHSPLPGHGGQGFACGIPGAVVGTVTSLTAVQTGCGRPGSRTLLCRQAIHHHEGPRGKGLLSGTRTPNSRLVFPMGASATQNRTPGYSGQTLLQATTTPSTAGLPRPPPLRRNHPVQIVDAKKAWPRIPWSPPEATGPRGHHVTRASC